MTEELSPEKAGAFAERLNRLVDRLHDPTISGNPFEWSGSEERAERNREILETVSRELRAYRHVSKASTVKKILTWGVAAPLVSILVLLLSGAYASGAGQVGLGLVGTVIVASAVTAIVIGRKPSVDLDLALALYAVPRGWSFSRVGGPETWDLRGRSSSLRRWERRGPPWLPCPEPDGDPRHRGTLRRTVSPRVTPSTAGGLPCRFRPEGAP